MSVLAREGGICTLHKRRPVHALKIAIRISMAVNDDLKAARDRATFHTRALTAFLYGGEKNLRRRDEIAAMVMVRQKQVESSVIFYILGRADVQGSEAVDVHESCRAIGKCLA